jgi:hypothetical protein
MRPGRPSVEFCSRFDEALARTGPAAVFLPDRDGRLRFDAEWTRDCWERVRGPLDHGWTWTLVRDHDTAFVNLLLVTSPRLLERHPRADVRAFDAEDEAMAAWRGFGRPPIGRQPW